MDESYETFEEELGPPRPPQRPGRQMVRPEMHASRRLREEAAPVQQQHHHPAPQVTRTLPREASPSLRKPVSVQSPSPADTPWESVTLNRCLFVVITILVVTSGMHRLHEMLRGQRIAEEEEEEVCVATRRSALRRKALYNLPEPQSSLWDVMMLWWPDFDDDAECDEDEGDCDDEGGADKREKSKKGASRRNKKKPRADKKQPKHGKLKDGTGRAPSDRDEGLKEKTKERKTPKEHEEEGVNEEEEKEEGGKEEEEKEEEEKEEGEKEEEMKPKKKMQKKKATEI